MNTIFEIDFGLEPRFATKPETLTYIHYLWFRQFWISHWWGNTSSLICLHGLVF